MKCLVQLLVLLLLPLQQSHAANITGKVRAHGKEVPEADASSGKYGSRKYTFLERVDYNSMHDFLVFIEGAVGTNAAPPDKPVQVVTTRKITQKGAMFT